MAQNPQLKPQVQVNPQVKGGAVPYLTVDGAAKAAEFYTKAFAAEIAAIHPPDEDIAFSKGGRRITSPARTSGPIDRRATGRLPTPRPRP